MSSESIRSRQKLPFTDASGNLDPERIASLRALDGAGEDLFTELSAMFLDRSHALLAKLRQGFATGDHAAIMQCAHSLGGGASNVGAQRMSRLSKQIELLTSRGKILDSREKMAELETEFQLVEKELARIAELPPGPE